MKPIIQSPTPNIKLSQEFYEKLAFSIVEAENGFYALSENLIIEVNADRFARAGLKLIMPNWKDFLTNNDLLSCASKTATGYLLTSPAGCCVYLEETVPAAIMIENDYGPTILGTFAGLSLETNQIIASITFWEKFGLLKTAGNIDHGWISLSKNGGFSISLMKFGCCPHLFFNPSLSFFNGSNNLGIISEIRSLEITITEEITHFNQDNIVDNIIVRDPGGLGYFIFSD